MKINLLKSEVLDALDKVRHTVSGSKMIEILNCFCFRKDQVCTSTGIASTVTALPLNGMDFCVHAEKFYKMVQSLYDSIELELSDDGSSLKIKSNKSKFTMGTIQTRGFPEAIPTDTSMFCNATDFITAIRKVAFTVGVNAAKPALMGIGVFKNCVYSSDGKRISRCKINAEAQGAPLSIPASSVDQILRLGTPTYMVRNQNSFGCFYKESKTIFMTSCVAAEFPYNAADETFSAEMGSNVVTFPEDLPDAIERAKLFAPEEDTDIVLHNTEMGLQVTGVSERGRGEDILIWNVKEPFKFAVNPDFLRKALEITRQADISNVVTGDNRKVRFFEGGFDHMLALMALRG